MSIGFEGESGEFRTTTAHAPHTNALAELMDALAELAASEDADFSHTLLWNRDPEEYDFVIGRRGDSATIEVFEYPTGDRRSDKRVLVFSHSGAVHQTLSAFLETFQQLYDERAIDDFRENWFQEFPYKSYERLQKSVSA